MVNYSIVNYSIVNYFMVNKIIHTFFWLGQTHITVAGPCGILTRLLCVFSARLPAISTYVCHGLSKAGIKTLPALLCYFLLLNLRMKVRRLRRLSVILSFNVISKVILIVSEFSRIVNR